MVERSRACEVVGAHELEMAWSRSGVTLDGGGAGYINALLHSTKREIFSIAEELAE